MQSTATRTVIDIRRRNSWFDLDLTGVWKNRELLWFLALRDLKVRYNQAVLGAAWAVIQPAFAVLIFSFVFGYLARLPSEGVPYPVFALGGIIPWTLFSEAARRSALGLIGDASLITKIYFPRLIIPISNVLTPLIDFAVGLMLLLALMIVYGVPISHNIVFLPIFTLYAILLALAVGLWLGPINVRFRDITHTLPFIIQIWMYATPIVYPASMVPQQWRTLYALNPVVGVIEGMRWSIFGTTSIEVGPMLASAVVTCVLLAASLVFFRRAERHFPDLV